MDKLHWVTISHANFPDEILSKKQCECLLATLNKIPVLMAQFDSADIVHGWLRLSYRQPKTLHILQKTISSIAALTQLHLKIVLSNFPSLWILHLDIPSSIAETREETLRILSTENPDIECKLWKVLCVTEVDEFQEYVLSITKSCFHHLNTHNGIVRFKRQTFTGRIDSNETDTIPITSRVRDKVKLTEYGERYAERLCRFLIDSGIDLKEAQGRANLASTKFAQFKNIVKKYCRMTRTGFNFFHFLKKFHNFIYLQLFDEILTQPSKDGYLILCHNNFPKIFLSNNTLNEIRDNLMEFLKVIPIRLTVSNVIVEDGWLKIYGNDVSLKWLAWVPDTRKFPFRLLTKDEVPAFGFVHLSVPIIENNDLTIKNCLSAENVMLNHADCFIARMFPCNDTHEIVTVTMVNSTFENLKLNSFLVKYMGDTYVLEPYSHEFDNNFISNGVMVDEKQKLFRNLCTLELCDNDAIKRTGLASYKYLQFKIFAMRERLKANNADGFFSVSLFKDDYENIALFDEMLTQSPEATDSNKYFLLSHTNFPAQILASSQLENIKNKFDDFVDNMFIKSDFVSEICDIGWLKIRFSNEAALKWIKRVFQFMDGKCDDVKLTILFDIPKVSFIKMKKPSREFDDEMFLMKLRQENVNLSCQSWKIVKGEVSDYLIILVDQQSLKLLFENAFSVSYDGQLHRVWILENFTNFICKDKVESSDNSVEDKNACNEILNKEKAKLEQHLCQLGITLLDAQRRANEALEKYKQFKLLTKSKVNKGFSFFNMEILNKDFENLKIFDELLQSSKGSANNSFILCHNTFPNKFFTTYNLNHIRNKLNEYLQEMPIKLAISNITVDFGWLFVYYHNDETLKWFSRLGRAATSMTFPWKVLTSADVPKFGFINFTLPYNQTQIYKDKSLLTVLIQHTTINRQSMHIARRVPQYDNEEVTIVMDLPALNLFAKNSYSVQFYNNVYEGEPFKMTKNGSISIEKKVTQEPDYTVNLGCKNDEMNHLFDHLCAIGVEVSDARKRVEKALSKYEIFKANINFRTPTTKISFFSPDLIADNFQHTKNILLFDEMMSEPRKMTNDKFFIICHDKFPNVFFSSGDLSVVAEALFNFFEALPFKHNFGEVRIDEGWLRIYYGNNASLTWIKRVVNFQQCSSYKVKLLPSYDIPLFWAIFLTVTCNNRVLSKKEILLKIAEDNADINVSSWQIVRKLSKKKVTVLTITMDKKSFDTLARKLFQVQLSLKTYTAEPYNCELYNFVEPDESLINEIATTNVETADLTHQMQSFINDNKLLINKISDVVNHSDVNTSNDDVNCNESVSMDISDDDSVGETPYLKIIDDASINKIDKPVEFPPKMHNFVEFNKSLISSIRKSAEMPMTGIHEAAYNVSNTMEIDYFDSGKSSNDQIQLTAESIPIATESTESEIEINSDLNELILEQKIQKLKELQLEIKLEKLKRELNKCLKEKTKVKSIGPDTEGCFTICQSLKDSVNTEDVELPTLESKYCSRSVSNVNCDNKKTDDFINIKNDFSLTSRQETDIQTQLPWITSSNLEHKATDPPLNYNMYTTPSVEHLDKNPPCITNMPTSTYFPCDYQKSAPTHSSLPSEPWAGQNFYGNQNEPSMHHQSFTEMTNPKDEHDYAVKKFLDQLSSKRSKRSRDRSCEDYRRRQTRRSRSRSRGRRRSNSRSRRRSRRSPSIGRGRRKSRRSRSRSRNRRRSYSRENQYRSERFRPYGSRCRRSRSKSGPRCKVNRSKSRSPFISGNRPFAESANEAFSLLDPKPLTPEPPTKEINTTSLEVFQSSSGTEAGLPLKHVAFSTGCLENPLSTIESNPRESLVLELKGLCDDLKKIAKSADQTPE